MGDYTKLLDRIDGHLRALRTTGYEQTALSDLRDDITTLTDHVLAARLDAEGWERECRRLRERWCGNRWTGAQWCALRVNIEPDPGPGDTAWRTACGDTLFMHRPNGVALTFERRAPSCPDCREVLCLDQ